MAKVVRRLADGFGLPATFTLDACRHGGMTELEEAELTQGRGGHSRATEPIVPIPGTPNAPMDRALAPTRKRHAHAGCRQAGNAPATKFQNEARNAFQNDGTCDDAAPIA